VKHQTVSAFEKHLAHPNHLASAYMIITPCPFERRKMIGKVLACFPKNSLKICDIPEEVVAHLNTASLFEGPPAVFLDGVDLLKNQTLLQAYLAKPNPSSLLLLGASTAKPVSELYQKAKKEMVVLDLSEEKPWERKRRLQDWIIESAKKKGKTMLPKAAEALLDHIGMDAAGIFQEIEKLICFTGDRSEITERDIDAISATRDLATGWALSESVIFEGAVVPQSKTADLSFLLPFIGQLRYHLQNGLQVTEQASPSRFPQIRPQLLEKYQRKKAAFFRKGLAALYELEFAAKSGSSDFSLLFDRFTAKLR